MQVKELQEPGMKEAMSAALGGTPDIIITLTGVNDIVQHRSAQTYRHDLDNELKWQRQFTTNLAVLELPNINIDPPASLPSKLKRATYRYLFDGGRQNVLAEYRAAAHGVNAQIIPYDPFDKGYLAAPQHYDSKGIHLTTEQFHRLGGYLGQQVKIP